MPAPAAAIARGGDGARRARLTGAVAGGVLYFLGYLGWEVWPCLLVFLVPLWSTLERTRGLAAAMLAGLVFGLAAYAGGFLWLWGLVAAFLDDDRLFGAALWAAYGVWFAAGFAIYAALYRGIRRRGWSVAVAGIAPLLAVEWLRPELFPTHAGSALLQAPAWIQTADLGGPLLLSGLVAGANVVAFETWGWWRGRRSRPLAAWVTGLAVAAAALAYGRLRTTALEAAIATAPALRVGVVQANLGILEKTEQTVLTHRRHLEQTRELLAAGEVDLVVWPETAYIRGLRGPLPISGRPIVEDIGVPLLFGSGSVREEGGRRLRSNSSFLVGADGMIRDEYDKNMLIPLAEHMPLADLVPALGRWFPHTEEFGASTETPALHLGPWRIATPICYEAVHPEFVRRMVREARPHLIVTLANDAWFGHSQEPRLHLTLTRLRAVEHRRFLVRATNSGISAVVDPLGRVVAQTGVLTRENLRATVRLLDGETVYGRLGDWPGWVAAAVVALTLVFGRRPARSEDG